MAGSGESGDSTRGSSGAPKVSLRKTAGRSRTGEAAKARGPIEPDPVLRRFYAHWESWVAAVLGASVLPAGVVFLRRGIDRSSILLGVIGVVLCLVSLPLLIQSGLEVLRPPQLRQHTLVVPRYLHRSRRIPLETVAGVGLIYEIGGARAGWTMRLWTTDGSSYSVDAVRSFVRGHRQKTAPRPPEGTPWRHRPRLDWQAQANTRAGRATTAVFKQVVAVQGPSGPLVRLMEQCSAPSFGTYLAFWSPDGRIGWLDGEEYHRPSTVRR
ncbi:hypothetical protein M6D93_19130 [Jatrophihabitans telluris]|uniref:Uncharacterized protein n=1 Tax=Jatrophihabitans telluris TaxID=2038343 RepID=A0ABY4QZF5_9ACTN|nr:hypothetical protein [Jatrophihabitans telluris]UQX88371.1 hypothetical protein M6D93_19130 [Jatrophihabitans telluris]